MHTFGTKKKNKSLDVTSFADSERLADTDTFGHIGRIQQVGKTSSARPRFKYFQKRFSAYEFPNPFLVDTSNDEADFQVVGTALDKKFKNAADNKLDENHQNLQPLLQKYWNSLHKILHRACGGRYVSENRPISDAHTVRVKLQNY